jgi:hypothetical protein
MPGGYSNIPSLLAAGSRTPSGALLASSWWAFFFWGIYILEDAFANPPNAEAAAIISAAFLLPWG